MANIPKEYPPGSFHSAAGWEGQFARVSRWLDRLIKSRSPEDAEDFLYAFFQNCYHLRDWLGDVRTQDEIEKFLKGSLPLRIGRDVANLTKHLALNRPAAQGHELSILREFAGAGLGWFEDDSRLAFVTNHNDNGIVLDARAVAKECMRLWSDFLPDGEVVQQVKGHFQLSAHEFESVMAKAEAMSLWAKEAMAHRRSNEAR